MDVPIKIMALFCAQQMIFVCQDPLGSWLEPTRRSVSQTPAFLVVLLAALVVLSEPSKFRVLVILKHNYHCVVSHQQR